jgi:hypothetical protein
MNHRGIVRRGPLVIVCAVVVGVVLALAVTGCGQPAASGPSKAIQAQPQAADGQKECFDNERKVDGVLLQLKAGGDKLPASAADLVPSFVAYAKITVCPTSLKPYTIGADGFCTCSTHGTYRQ